jgi:hypothetical protein
LSALTDRRDLLLTETHAIVIYRPILLHTVEMSIVRIK